MKNEVVGDEYVLMTADFLDLLARDGPEIARHRENVSGLGPMDGVQYPPGVVPPSAKMNLLRVVGRKIRMNNLSISRNLLGRRRKVEYEHLESVT
jgi:hypothetical protein